MYEITSRAQAIDWEAQGEERIVQNARNLLCLVMGEVRLDVWRGIDAEIYDNTIAQMQEMARSEIVRVLAWEPGAHVEECGVRVDDEGAFLYAIITITERSG